MSLSTTPTLLTPNFWDPTWTSGSHKGRVEDFVALNGVLYVGWWGTNCDDPSGGSGTHTDLPYLTAIRNDTKALKTTWDSNADGKVRCLALHPTNGTIYAGGAFNNMGGSARASIAGFTPLPNAASTATFTLAASPNIACDGDVYDIVFNAAGTVAWVIGAFSNIAGQARRGVARFTISGGTWTIDTGFNASRAAFIAGGGGRAGVLKADESKLVVGWFPGSSGTDVSAVPCITAYNPATGAAAAWTNNVYYTTAAINNEHPGVFEAWGDTEGVYFSGLVNGGNSVCYMDWTGAGATSVTFQGSQVNLTTSGGTAVTSGNMIWYFGCDGNGQCLAPVSYNNKNLIAVGHHGDVVASLKNNPSGTSGAPGPVGNTTSHGIFMVTRGSAGGTLDSFVNPPGFSSNGSGDPLKLWAIYQDPATGDVHMGGDFTELTGGATNSHQRYADFAGSVVASSYTYQIDRGNGTFVTPSSGASGMQDTATYPVGSYTIRVRAIGADGQFGTPASVSFSTSLSSIPTTAPSSTTPEYAGVVVTGGTGQQQENNFAGRAAVELGGVVYLAGFFTLAGTTGHASQYVLNNPTTQNRFAAYTAATGAPTAWSPNADNDGYNIIAGPTGKVYISGAFTNILGTTRSKVALVTTAGVGTLDTTFNPPTINGRVTGLAYDPSTTTLYISGIFTTVGGSGRGGLAALDATTGTLKPWNPGIAGGTLDARRVLLNPHPSDQADIYVCGEFTTINGVSRLGLACVQKDPTLAGPLVRSWAPDLTGDATTTKPHDIDITPDGTRLIVATAGSDVGGDGNHGICYQLVTSQGALQRGNTRLWESTAEGDGGDHNACGCDNKLAFFGHHGDGVLNTTTTNDGTGNRKLYAVHINDGSSAGWILNPQPNSIQGTYGITVAADRVLVTGAESTPRQAILDYAYAADLTGPGPSQGDTQPPTAPTTLTATAAGASSITLNWGGATDNIAVTNYEITRGGSIVATIGNVLTYTDTGLTATTSYTYTVKALDAAGNKSPASISASATTGSGGDVTAPSVPTGLTATATGATGIHLSWNASTDNIAVTGYRIRRGGNVIASQASGHCIFAARSLPDGTGPNQGVQPEADFANTVVKRETLIGRKYEACLFFPQGAAPGAGSYVDLCVGGGRIPILKWAPGQDITSINNGSLDSQIHGWAVKLRALPKVNGIGPIFVWNQEYNLDTTITLARAGEFINAFRRIYWIMNGTTAQITTYNGISGTTAISIGSANPSAGATDVEMGWCPDRTANTDLTYAAAYPGNDYVYWACPDMYDKNPVDQLIDALLANADIGAGHGPINFYNTYKDRFAASGRKVRLGWFETGVRQPNDPQLQNPELIDFAAWIADARTKIQTLFPQFELYCYWDCWSAQGDWRFTGTPVPSTTLVGSMVQNTNPATNPGLATYIAMGQDPYFAYPGSISLAFDDTGLTQGTTYSYTVTAYDAAGNESAQSTSASATTTSTGLNPTTRYSFDNVTSTAITDDSGNGHTATAINYSGTPSTTTGPNGIGKALSFAGASQQRVEIPDAAGLDPLTAYTLSAWVYLIPVDTDPLHQRWEIMEKSVSTASVGGYGLNIRMDTTPLYLARTFSFYGGVFANHDSNTPILPNQWQHVAATYDGAQVKLYINGQLDATASQTGAIGDSTDALVIGAKHRVLAPAVIEAFWNGSMDEVQTFNRALTATEIAQLATPPQGQVWTDITGATARTYSPITSDAGRILRAKVVATNRAGTATAFSDPTSAVIPFTPPTVPRNLTAPSITPNTYTLAGTTLTCDAGTWDQAESFAFTWLRLPPPYTGTPIQVQTGTSTTYVRGTGDNLAQIKCRVTATNSLGSTSADSPYTSQPAAPVNLIPPSIDDTTPTVGQILHADPGQWSSDVTSLNQQWIRTNNGGSNTQPITGATSPAYTVATTDLAYQLAVQVTATNANGITTQATTAWTSIVAAAGTAPVLVSPPVVTAPPAIYQGSVIVATPATWQTTPTSDSYQWQRQLSGAPAWLNITGATSPTYTIQTNGTDDHYAFRLVETATNAGGSTITATPATTVAIGAPIPWDIAFTIPSPGGTVSSYNVPLTITITGPQIPTRVYAEGDSLPWVTLSNIGGSSWSGIVPLDPKVATGAHKVRVEPVP